MKTTLTLIFSILIISCCAQDTIIFSSDGALPIKVVGTLTNGKYNGPVTTFHYYGNDTGYKIYSKTYFINGKNVGPDSTFDEKGKIWKVYQFLSKGTQFTSYHDNGKISLVGFWKDNDDKKFGQWVSFYENGQIEFIENFSNGKEHGYAIHFFPNGKLQSSGLFSKGFRTGSWTEGDSLGKSISVGRYKAISLFHSELDSIPLLPDSVDFQIYAPCQVKWTEFGVKDGVWTVMDASNGSVIDRRKYMNGRLKK